MKKIRNLIVLVVLVFVLCIMGNTARAETVSPEAAYQQIITYGQQYKWGLAFECFDKEAQEMIVSIVEHSIYLQNSDELDESNDISLKDRFIKAMNKNVEITQSQNIDLSASIESTVVKAETKGEFSKLTVLNNAEAEEEVFMRKVNGKWKMYFPKDSMPYKLAQTLKSKGINAFYNILMNADTFIRSNMDKKE